MWRIAMSEGSRQRSHMCSLCARIFMPNHFTFSLVVVRDVPVLVRAVSCCRAASCCFVVLRAASCWCEARMKMYRWAEAHIKIARMTLTIKLDGNWSSFQLANSAPPLSVTDSAIAPSARILGCRALLETGATLEG